MAKRKLAPAKSLWRKKIHSTVFEAETLPGKLFDLGLLATVGLTVLIIILESIEPIQAEYGAWLGKLEWTITICFTIEYILRLICLSKPLKYAGSFYGLVDLLSILPTYLVFLFGGHSLLVLRSLRLLRIFRVLKLTRFLGEAEVLLMAIKSSRPKIAVFMFAVITVALIMGTVMYYVEGHINGFDNILKGIYWAIVTMTTVGYGDIAPTTPFGQAIASLLMIMGYAIIAIPTGIVSVELAHATKLQATTRNCRACSREGHSLDATFCRFCGSKL